MKIILVFLAVVGLLIPIPVKAQSTLALQEKCAEGAREWLKDHPSGAIHSHSSHYNKKLSTCFIRIDCFISETGTQLVQLYDTSESGLIQSRLIGSYSQTKDGALTGCYVGTRKCESRTKFDSLIKPYMEE